MSQCLGDGHREIKLDLEEEQTVHDKKQATRAILLLYSLSLALFLSVSLSLSLSFPPSLHVSVGGFPPLL